MAVYDGRPILPPPLPVAMAEDVMMNFSPVPPTTDTTRAAVIQPRLIASAGRPSLTDAAAREERKAMMNRSVRDDSVEDVKPGKRVGKRPSDGSTEDDEDSMAVSRVVYPPPETVQGAALMIHGIKRKGAKSRVETQIKMRISVVQPPSHSPDPSPARIGTFRAIRLQPGLGVKRRAKKAAEIDQTLGTLDPRLVLRLETQVWCTDDPERRAFACVKCVMRERKRAMSKSAAGRKAGRPGMGEESEDGLTRQGSEADVGMQPVRQAVDADGLTQEDREKIVLFNCGNLVELVEGECELPMRVTCYCRHHKEKTGFRIVMNLLDVHGRIVATGQTPTIMITDDHKTSGGKANGTTTEHSASSVARKKVREPSASTEDERRRAGKKPYDRKPASIGERPTGMASPRSTYPHGLSMTPLQGSIPGSPAPERNYFTLPIPGVQPGSGAVSPSLLMANGHGQEPDRSLPNSPLGISDALPAISQRLSDWAAESSWQTQMQYPPFPAQPTGIALDVPHAVEQRMTTTEDDAWAYASSEGGASQHPGSSSFSQDAFAFASPRSSMHGRELGGYGYHSGTSGTGASDISVNNLQALRFEPEPDFESMLNLSPPESPVDLPMDGPSPISNASNADSYQNLGWSPQPPAPVPEISQGPPRPKITRLVPMEGPTHGGIEVTVLGENFYPGMVCAFGSFHALTVQTYGPTTIVCVLPPSPTPGQVPVHVVEANGGPSMQPPIYFTYQDATDRKLMEMALTAVGLRVTGKVVGAVEIARRIMSAPGAGQEEQPYRADSAKEQELADELAKTVRTAQDTQSAILKFLAAFVAPSRRKHSQTALNHVNSEGQTLLHLASLLGYDRLVKLLLRANATIDIHDRNGYSALAFAAIGGNAICVKLLLDAGAKVGAFTFTNHTALSLAQKAGHAGIAQMLSDDKPRKPRRPSVHSRSSVDADNPSSTDDVESPAAVEDALSPTRLTTVEDILAIKRSAKSDGTVTPRPRQASLSDDPPPYAAVDGASWLQRTLSHIPGAQMMPPTPQLKDFIPPVLWDKLPSAQLLIPHLPNLPSPTNFRPGELMEQQWASQAWLAVPIQTWMNALPMVGQGEANVPAPEPPVRRYRTPTREREAGLKRRVGTKRRKDTRPVEGIESQMQRDKKPDRMLFLFWLPVLAMAFCYTIITAVPYAVGRALLMPVMRALECPTDGFQTINTTRTEHTPEFAQFNTSPTTQEMQEDAEDAPEQHPAHQDMTSTAPEMSAQHDLPRTISMDLSGMHDSRRRNGWRKSKEDSEGMTGDARKVNDLQLGPVIDVQHQDDESASQTNELIQESTTAASAILDTMTDPVEMISPTPIRMTHSSILGQHPTSRESLLDQPQARDRPRSSSTSTTGSVILITSSPNPGAQNLQPSSGNGHSLGVPSRSPRPQPVGTVPLSNPFERTSSPNPSIRSHSSQAFAPSSRRSSFSFSLSMGSGREKTPSPAPEIPDSSEGRNHGRKASISRSIAGALIPGWNTAKDDGKVKRGKSPAPGGRKSMDWGTGDASGNRGMTPSASSATITPETRNSTTVPPPVAAKPGWLRRTASGNKMLAGLGLGSSAGSSYSLAASSNRDLAEVAETQDETPQTTRMGPPSLPERKQRTKENRAPALPPRKGHAIQGSTSRLSIASALDFRRPKSPGRMPSTGSTSSSVPEPRFHLPVSPDPAFSKSYDATTAVPETASSQGLLPPPPQRVAQSMDIPRKVSPGTRHQPGSSTLGSLSTVNALQGRGNQRSKPPDGIAFPTSGSSSFLQAAPGAIGSAVSTGWAAIRSTRSSMSFPHSSSSTFPRSGSTADSSWIRVDANGNDVPSRTGLGYEGPKLSPEAVKRPPGREGGLTFGKQLEIAAELCPVADTHLETGTDGRRKRRKRCLPAVAIRCVDHLSIWAPQEEGIFRISGRTTHITQLRKQFDAGADIVLELCDPGDLDPHAVASLYRSYLRELPSSILTEDVMPNFNRLIDGHKVDESPSNHHSRTDLLHAQRRDDRATHNDDLIAGLRTILQSLSDSSWWLLNDLSRILALTSQHSQVNKMTIQNLLTVFSPSLKISMTFLKLLVEHHESIFKDEVPSLADRRGKNEQLSLLPDLLITSDADEQLSSKANSLDVPAIREERVPSPAPSERARFSTPIADKFARTGPVIISFREPPPEQQQNQ